MVCIRWRLSCTPMIRAKCCRLSTACSGLEVRNTETPRTAQYTRHTLTHSSPPAVHRRPRPPRSRSPPVLRSPVHRPPALALPQHPPARLLRATPPRNRLRRNQPRGLLRQRPTAMATFRCSRRGTVRGSAVGGGGDTVRECHGGGGDVQALGSGEVYFRAGREVVNVVCVMSWSARGRGEGVCWGLLGYYSV